jgi:uncharacterized membrane protein
MKKLGWSMWAIVAVSFAIAIYLYFYSQLPDVITSHWNALGEANGSMGKFWGLFLMPLISLVLLLFFKLIPRIDPLKKNIKIFKREFDWFIVLILLFLLYIYLLTIAWNFGSRFNMIQFMAPAFAVLFYFAGTLIGRIKRNWFVGIRTPWTLSSDKIWDKTHALGRKLFKIAGILSLGGVIFPSYAIWFIIAPIILFALYLILYSYLTYQKENH